MTISGFVRMTLSKIIISAFIFVFTVFTASSQDVISHKLALAENYKRSLDYKRAMELYQEILEERYVEEAYYGLSEIYYEQRMYPELIPITVTALEKSKPNFKRVELMALLGELRFREGKKKDADSLWNEALELYPLMPETYNTLAGYQQRVGQFDKALATYQKGNEDLDGNLFTDQIIKLLINKRDYVSAVPLILESMEDSKNINTAMGRLYPFMNISEEAQTHIGSIIKDKHNSRSNILYSELYLWYLNTVDDMDEAFSVVKKLDDLKNGDGREIISFASSMVQDGKYDVAIKAYQYLMDLGKSHKYYHSALYGFANSTQKEMEAGNKFSEEEAQELLDLYLELMDEGDRSNIGAIATLKAATLYYEPMEEPDKSIELLQKLNELYLITAENFEGQRLLARIYTEQGEFDKAIGIYKEMPNTFRRTVDAQILNNQPFELAKIYVFKGEIEKAGPVVQKAVKNSSLDVANDAIELNQILSSSKDTTRLQEFGKAYYQQYKGDLDKAIEAYKELGLGSDGLALQSQYLVSSLSLENDDYATAVEYADLIRDRDILSPMAERASLIKGKAYLAMGDRERSLDTFKRFMMDYPESIHIDEVRKIARELRSEL